MNPTRAQFGELRKKYRLRPNELIVLMWLFEDDGRLLAGHVSRSQIMAKGSFHNAQCELVLKGLITSKRQDPQPKRGKGAGGAKVGNREYILEPTPKLLKEFSLTS